MSTKIERAISLGVSANTTEAQRDLAKLDRIIQSVKTPTESLAKSQRLLNEAYKAGEVAQRDYARAAERIANEQARVRKLQADTYAQRVSGQRAGESTPEGIPGLAISKHVKQLAIAVGAFEALRRSVKLASDVEATQKKFEVLTGSVDEAARLMQSLRIPGATNESTQSAARNLLQFGMHARDVSVVVRQLANITGGNAQQLDNLSLAYAQTQGAGRLMGQELLQMINAGFNPLQAISKRTGESIGELKKRMEAGGISAEEVAEAFREVTAEGGRFYGMLDQMANTTEGQFNRLKMSASQLGVSFGKTIEPVTKGGLKELNFLLGSVQLQMDLMTKDGPAKMVTDLDSWISTVRELQSGRGTLIGSIANRFFDAETIGKQDRAIAMADEMAQLSKLRKLDPKLLSQTQRDAIRLADQFERNAKLTSDRDFAVSQKLLNESMRSATTDEERARLQADFLQSQGPGRFDDGGLAKAKEAQKLIADLAKQEQETKRVGEAFKSPLDAAQNRLIDKRYGDNASSVRTLRDQSAGDERRTIDRLLDEAAAYEKIYAAANATAKAEADRLSQLEKSIKAIEDQEEATKKREKVADQLRDLDAEIAYRKELITLGRDQTEINRLMQRDDMSKSDATAIRERQRMLEGLDSDARISPASAPSAINYNSAEMFSAMANAQANRVSEQIRLQREHLRKQVDQLAELREIRGVLAEMDSV